MLPSSGSVWIYITEAETSVIDLKVTWSDRIVILGTGNFRI